jgi:magnesium transporter
MPAQAVASHVVTGIPVAHEATRVDRVIAMLREPSYASADAILVIDDHGQLVGTVAVGALIHAPATQLIGELADRTCPYVHAHEDQEHVATAALRGGTALVVVVDSDRRPVGIVPAPALLAILRQEHVDDLHRLAGIETEHTRDREALEGPPLRRVRHRLPWLLVGLVGSMVSALIMARYETLLARDLAIAFFVPAIVYLADAIGTQTEAIVVRGLSLSRVTLRHLLGDELRTGLLIGATLAALAFPLVGVAFGDLRLAAAVSTAIVGAGMIATTIGLLLPWMLHRRGFDPAFGSGPVATIIQDVTSLIVYFALATLIVD